MKTHHQLGSLLQQVGPLSSFDAGRQWHYYRLLEVVAEVGDVRTWKIEDVADGYQTVVDDVDLAQGFDLVVAWRPG